MKQLMIIAVLAAPACATARAVPERVPRPMEISVPEIDGLEARSFAWTGDWLGELSEIDGQTVLLVPGVGADWPADPGGPVSDVPVPAPGAQPRLLARFSLENAPPGRYCVVTTLLYQGTTGASPGKTVVRGATVFTQMEAFSGNGGERVLTPVEEP